MADRLNLASLASVPADVTTPAYDPAHVKVGILHLGLGAFHRAHQAVYTDDLLASDPRWGICGVSLKTPRAIEPLAAQDGLYSYLERTSDGVRVRVIGESEGLESDILSMLKEAEELYKEEWFEEAITIAVKNNKRNWKYVEAILKRWKEDGTHGQKDQQSSKKSSERYTDSQFSEFLKRD